MSVAEEIVAYFVAQGIGTDADVDGMVDGAIFRDFMPETPNTCGAVITYGGAPPVNGLGVDGIQFESPGVQVRFRGEPHENDLPKAKTQLAYVALGKIQAESLSGTPYVMIRPVRAPEIFKRDESNRVTWMVNAICEKELSAP
ncbi:MAG: minor capsid protein [Hyphomicrobium sp.]